MATIIDQWCEGSVCVAVEAGKDDMNREGTHVHIYKSGRRTKSRIPGKNIDMDSKDFYIAERLFNKHYYEIDKLCDDVKKGKYDG